MNETDMQSICEKYRPTLEEGIGLPGETYTSANSFEAGKVKVFAASWCCIGLAQDAEMPGDIMPVEFTEDIYHPK